MKRLCVVAVLLLAGCSGSSKPAAHVVTAAQANELALMRFVNYRGTGQHFRADLGTAKGTVAFDGYVDYRQGIGYAQVSQSGESITLQWNRTTLLDWPGTGTTPPATLPSGTPSAGPLTPTASDTNALLSLLVQLGQDRPDNAQLITQDGARWLRSDTIGSTKVDVMQGPAPQSGSASAAANLTYWVDAQSHLLRIDAAFGGGSPTQIDLDPNFRAIPKASQLS